MLASEAKKTGSSVGRVPRIQGVKELIIGSPESGHFELMQNYWSPTPRLVVACDSALASLA